MTAAAAVRVWGQARTASPKRRRVESERLNWRDLIKASNAWPRKPE